MKGARITRVMTFAVPLGLLAFSLCAAAQAPAAAKRVAHVSNSFSFTVPASLHDAAPLFGPAGERAWAGTEWDPQFLFPSPAKDVEGAVFTVQHGEHRSVWVNTRFDLEAGHMQYVAVLPDLLVSTIDVALHPIDATHTRVDVNYVRTALRPKANEHVVAMGDTIARKARSGSSQSGRISPDSGGIHGSLTAPRRPSTSSGTPVDRH